MAGAVSIIRSTVLTNRDAQKPNDLRTAGRNFMKRAICTTVAADSANSQYGFFAIPSNAVLTSVLFSAPTPGSGARMDFGLWETPQFSGHWSATTGWTDKAGSLEASPISNADQYFCDSLDIATAKAKTECLYLNSAWTTLANCDQMVWQILGFTTDPQRDFDVVITCEVAIPNAVAMLVEISYKLE